MPRTALLSVYNKRGIAEFAKSLVKLDWNLYASGGTAKALHDAKVPVSNVTDLVGKPILGHRVVTLSREIHAGLLARPDEPDDLAELKKLGIPLIDLVCVDLYPLQTEIAKPGSTLASVIEQTDIGGPAMLRAAAKGGRIVIADHPTRQEVLDWLKAGEPQPDTIRNQLAARAEAVVAAYGLASARYRSQGRAEGVIGTRAMTFPKGENAWQSPAAYYSAGLDDPLAFENFRLIAGSEPSYNNAVEIAGRHLPTITHIAAGFERNFGKVPLVAIGTKHGNPCGAAAGDDPGHVIRQMVTGDTRAIFGGLVMTTFEIDKALADELIHYHVGTGRRLLDAVAAPAFTDDAVAVLERKGGRCRLLANPALASLSQQSLDRQTMLRPVRGGFAAQPNYTYILDFDADNVTITGELSDQHKRDLVLAWAVGSTSNSNTITLVKNGQLIGNGVGQQDRVGCCELAIKRATDAGHDTLGAAAYSDSFFPFPDGPEVLADAGVSAVWSTSGSVRDDDTRRLASGRGIALVQVPDAAGRGFYGH